MQFPVKRGKWRTGALAVLLLGAAACADDAGSPLQPVIEPAAPRLDLVSESCAAPGSGTYCGVGVTFSAHNPTWMGRGFQTTADQGTGHQGPITVTFSKDVRAVTVTALDPDLAGNYIAAFDAGGREIKRVYFDGDGTPGTFTESRKTIEAPHIRSVRLVGDPSDWTVWENLALVPGCTANAPGTYCGTSVGISPWYAPTVQGRGFAANSTTGWQQPITVTFGVPVKAVSVTALDPDFAGNYMAAYDAAGAEVGRVYFTGDGKPGVLTADTRFIEHAAGIARVVLVSDPSDYTVWENVSFLPGASGPPPEPIELDIGGQDYINVGGDYEWIAVAYGGTGTFAYQWWYRPAGDAAWTPVGNAGSYVRSVSPSDASFELRVRVTSGAASAERTLAVTVDPTNFMIVRYPKTYQEPM